MISSSLRAKIKGYLEGFLQGLIEDKKRDRASGRSSEAPSEQARAARGDYRPFHEAILPEGLLRVTEFERSFSTRLGTTFEEVARLIGQENWGTAQRAFGVSGTVSSRAVRTVERICNRITTGGIRKPWPKLVEEVLRQAEGPGDERKRTADLYLADGRGHEIFFEIKSPKPNKGQCVEVADRLLQIHAIRREGPPRVRTFFAMAYNPYGEDRAAYKHSLAISYLDMRNQVVVGREFWDLVGGAGTYDEVLDIYREVGREKGPDMLEQLALDY
jgi:hypothetical protein